MEIFGWLPPSAHRLLPPDTSKQAPLEVAPMSEPIRSPHSETEPLPAEILELANAIDQLPPGYRAQISPLMLRVMESTRRRRRILNMVQDALAQLRLDMKYLIFDLEATRRERDAYRQQLEEQNNHSGGDDNPPLDL